MSSPAAPSTLACIPCAACGPVPACAPAAAGTSDWPGELAWGLPAASLPHSCMPSSRASLSAAAAVAEAVAVPPPATSLDPADVCAGLHGSSGADCPSCFAPLGWPSAWSWCNGSSSCLRAVAPAVSAASLGGADPFPLPLRLAFSSLHGTGPLSVRTYGFIPRRVAYWVGSSACLGY